MDDDDEVQHPVILLPGHEARTEARAIIGLTVLVLALGALLYLAAPGCMCPMVPQGEAPHPLGVAVPVTGIGMLLVGLAWMARIYRSAFNGEPEPEHWRYRAR